MMDTHLPPAASIPEAIGVYTVIYNIFTNSNTANTNGKNLYTNLDQYFAQTAKQLLSEAPKDSPGLIKYVLSCFDLYSTRASIASRNLFSYYDRSFVRKAATESRRWLMIEKKRLSRRLERRVSGDSGVTEITAGEIMGLERR